MALLNVKINGTLGAAIKAIGVFVLVSSLLVGFGKVLGSVTNNIDDICEIKENAKEQSKETKRIDKEVVALKTRQITIDERTEKMDGKIDDILFEIIKQGGEK